MELLAKYNNGNYSVKLYDNGTKVRYTKADSFIAEFPENIDIKITDKCDAGCPFCHENSTPNGKHADLLNTEFLSTLQPGTELAIGGGNPLEHPNLLLFLQLMKRQGVICNLTVNAIHLTNSAKILLDLMMKLEYIHGLGISVNEYNQDVRDFAMNHQNVVLHMINGVISFADLMKFADPHIKILLLGYKLFRRGNLYFAPIVQDKMSYLKDNLKTVLENFGTVSFDNLAIWQLKIRDHMSPKEWNTFYMGDDGNFTMYIDMVNRKFAMNSTSEKRFDIMDDICDMFQVVKEEANESDKLLQA